jgi:hypothetical protein
VTVGVSGAILTPPFRGERAQDLLRG